MIVVRLTGAEPVAFVASVDPEACEKGDAARPPPLGWSHGCQSAPRSTAMTSGPSRSE
jgi:hypothetical protein